MNRGLRPPGDHSLRGIQRGRPDRRPDEQGIATLKPPTVSSRTDGPDRRPDEQGIARLTGVKTHAPVAVRIDAPMNRGLRLRPGDEEGDEPDRVRIDAPMNRGLRLRAADQDAAPEGRAVRIDSPMNRGLRLFQNFYPPTKRYPHPDRRPDEQGIATSLAKSPFLSMSMVRIDAPMNRGLRHSAPVDLVP